MRNETRSVFGVVVAVAVAGTGRAWATLPNGNVIRCGESMNEAILKCDAGDLVYEGELIIIERRIFVWGEQDGEVSEIDLGRHPWSDEDIEETFGEISRPRTLPKGARAEVEGLAAGLQAEIPGLGLAVLALHQQIRAWGRPSATRTLEEERARPSERCSSPATRYSSTPAGAP